MDISLIILLAATVCGFLMAFSLGANDVANSMASAVGAKAISLKKAIIIASLLNFVGAVFLGSHVAATIYKGIINPAAIGSQYLLMLGMFAALLSSGIWVLLATYTGLPVSSTHSIVGSIMGFGLIAGGPDVVQWGKMTAIVISWIVSPFFGALIAYLVFSHIRKTIIYSRDVIPALKRWAPFWGSLTISLVVLSFCFKTPLGKGLGLTWVHGIIITMVSFTICTTIGRKMLDKILTPDAKPLQSIDEVFKNMQVGTACYVALSQGANDVANAIGPVIAIYYIATVGSLDGNLDIPLWLLMMGGVGIATGIACLGYKVMGTIGEKITKMNNSRGFSVAFSAATTVLMASNLGMPVSTTHASVGAVAGVGLARGFHAVDFRVLGKIFLYWILTIPIAGFSCIVIFQILRWSFPETITQ